MLDSLTIRYTRFISLCRQKQIIANIIPYERNAIDDNVSYSPEVKRYREGFKH